MELGKLFPFVSRTFEWGVAITTFLSVLIIVPRHCALLTYFLYPKLRKINAVLITPQLISLTLPRLRRPEAFPKAEVLRGDGLHLQGCPRPSP